MCVPYSPRKTKTIALCQIDIKILVTVGTLFQFDRDSGGLVLFLSSGHVFGTGDVLVVCNTAVLVHLQEKVVVDCKIITSRGMGTAIDFAAKLVELLKGTKEKDELLESIVYGE